MFQIKYRIFREDVIPIENDEFYGEYGYFFIQMGEKEYGFYHEKKLSTISSSIYWSFSYLLEGLLKVLEKKYEEVFISDVDHYKLWLKLKVCNDMLTLSKVYFEKWEGSRAIEPTIKEYEVVWEENILLEVFLKEILMKSSNYLEELFVLNDKNKYLDELKELIKEVKKLYQNLSEEL